jgi:uncharacterized protein YifN (PemK superfamily)
MKFEPGADQRRNKAGRPKGTPNKSTDALRNTFRIFLEKNVPEMQKAFDQLDAWQKLQIIERVAKLILPAPLHPLQQLSDQEITSLINQIRKGEL